MILSNVKAISIPTYERVDPGRLKKSYTVYNMKIDYDDGTTETYKIRWSDAAEIAETLQRKMRDDLGTNFVEYERKQSNPGSVEAFRTKNLPDKNDETRTKRKRQLERYFNGIVEYVKGIISNTVISVPDYQDFPVGECTCDTTIGYDHELCPYHKKCQIVEEYNTKERDRYTREKRKKSKAGSLSIIIKEEGGDSNALFAE